MRGASFALALLLACTSLSPDPSDPPPLGRLPADVQPLHYGLELEILPTRDRYSGRVSIDVELARARQGIWMHGRGLAVERAQVRGADGSVQRATWQEIPGSDGVAALRTPRAVGPGRVSLELEFHAPLVVSSAASTASTSRNGRTPSRSSSRPPRARRSPASTSPRSRPRST
jgi:alanyl aminopeptidase